MGSIKFAFFGLMGKSMKIRTLGTERALEVRDPVETAKKLVPELRRRRTSWSSSPIWG